ncbi:MAG: methyltransferase domain-containing protein, partial [Candidatus Aureabacteria bacterium]|nr:methyltransferase domain-containing protein [Candidatus Auribacterota bacterium]
EVLEDVQVVIGYKKVYEGRAAVIDLREQGRALVVGLKLEESMLEVDKILYMGKSEDIKNDLKEFLHMLPIGNKVSGEFKQIVADMRYYLESIEAKLNKEEIRLANLDLGLKHNIEKDILNAVIKSFTKTMNAWFLKLNDLIKNLKKEEHEIHKKYFQNQLHHLLLQSPFIRRAVDRPFGYSGDYGIINMINGNAYDGETLLGKLLSKHGYNVDAAQVVRLRTKYIKDLILEKGKQSLKKENSLLRVLSVGCGPAKEVEGLLKEDSWNVNSEFCLLDFDERALFYIEEKLFKRKRNSSIKINFLAESIKSMIKNRTEQKYNLIYTLGLLDYLSENVCKKVLKSLFDRLDSDGTLIIGQYAPGNSSRAYMELALDWYLIYRDNDDMLEWLEIMDEQFKNSFHAILKDTCNCLILSR